MPSRLSKAFQRRRSSGNNVYQNSDGGANKSEGTFRVLQRAGTDSPDAFHRAAGRGPPPPLHAVKAVDSRPWSYNGGGFDASYRPGNNTNTSTSTANTVTSQRPSYSSTDPSSVEFQDARPGPDGTSKSDMDSPLSVAADQHQAPPPQQSRTSFSLKNAGRACSFGSKNKQNAEAKQERDRAPTASSYASTATPPKLDFGDTSIGSGGFSDFFGNSRNGANSDVPPVPPLPANATSLDHDTAVPRRPSSPSGYSWTSNASQEQLMSSPPGKQAAANETPHFLSQFGVDSDLLTSIYGGGSGSTSFGAQGNSKSSAPQPPRHIPDRTVPRSTAAPPSTWIGQRTAGNPATRPPPFAYSRPSENPYAPERASNDPNGDDEPLFDAPRLRRPYRQLGRNTTMTKKTTGNKVMTPAEFEAAKKRRDLGIKDDEDGESSASSESDAYEDDDEVETTKIQAKQRRKQEAQLTVYRQQMMKVTGEQPSELPRAAVTRPAQPLRRASNSAGSMLGSLPWESKDKQATGKANKSSDEDEDDDVPLGVLQAHGFPSKASRPPTRLSMAGGSNPSSSENVQRSYPTPAGATRNEPTAGGGGNPNLPVFAKNLPQDPYVGASLVNAGRREPLGMGGESPPVPGVPHGGLVGIIAEEERARALRRGSPNTAGTYDNAAPNMLPMDVHEQMLRQQMMAQQMGDPNAQAQVNAQMMQMMQMQMQWMQQMMQMQGMQTPPMEGMPGMPPMMAGQPNGFTPQGMRPASQASFQVHSRDVSRMSRGPTPSQFGGPPASSAPSVFGMPGPGYAASIAPSERSVVGQPSRYRPVTPGGATTNPQNNAASHSRTSTLSINALQQNLPGQRSQSRLGTQSTDDLRKTMTTPSGSANGDRPTIKAINKPKGGRVRYDNDDDNDDKAWEEMQRKRAERKSKWRTTKALDAASSFSGEQEGYEGLYYEG